MVDSGFRVDEGSKECKTLSGRSRMPVCAAWLTNGMHAVKITNWLLRVCAREISSARGLLCVLLQSF